MTTSQNYKKLSYDQILVRLKKGKRDEYKRAAEKLGLSLSMLVQNAVEEYIQNHSGAVPVEEAKLAEALSLAEIFHSFPEDVQDKLLEAMNCLVEHTRQKQ